MPLYVLALTDGPVDPDATSGPALHSIDFGGIYAICERRRAVPAATDEALRRQHRAVIEIARRVRAVLPVRFGALIEKGALAERLSTHEAEIRRGLDDVRGRVQMIVRVLGKAPAVAETRAATGRQYLEARRRIIVPPLPPQARALLSAVRPLVVRERREPGAAGLLATFYHLVAEPDVPRYSRAAGKAASSAVVVTGPWPPFAFTPQLW